VLIDSNIARKREVTVLIHAPATDQPAQPIDSQAKTQALADAVTAAGYAPTLQGTQPWRWRLGDNQLDLFEDRERVRQIDVADSRLALLSCGAALHHAFISLAADGWHAIVSRLPTGEHPDHIARIRLDHRIPVQPAATQDLQNLARRRKGAGSAFDVPIDADKLRSLSKAVESEGALLQVLRPNEVLDLVIAAQHTPHSHTDAALEHNLLARSQDRTVRLAVLFGRQERRLDWLRAGEALSALWTTATELGLSVKPLCGAAETEATRAVMSRRVPARSYPYLLLRFATLGPDATATTTTDRNTGPRFTRA
jgi:hypothetical protein